MPTQWLRGTRYIDDGLSSEPISMMSQQAFKILIDGDCPLCRREGRFLARLDRGRGLLAFENIAAPDFDPGKYGVTHERVMGSIHGILPSGSIVTGVEVFRRAYAAVGWGWLVAWTGWPVLRPLVDRFYVVFAKYRPRLSGRGAGCASGTCKVPGVTPTSPAP